MPGDDEILARMRRHPVGWRYADLARLLRRAGFLERSTRGSHRKWVHRRGVRLILVDAPGAVKPEYVRETVTAIEASREHTDEDG